MLIWCLSVGLVFNFINLLMDNRVEAQTRTENKSDNILVKSQQLPIIKPSDVIEKLEEKLKSNPEISALEIADIGNSLIKKNGFNFSFHTCEIAEVNNIADENIGGKVFRPFDYEFTNLSGQKEIYRLLNKSFGAPCGCVFDIPLSKASKNELTLIAAGKPKKVKHLDKYNLEIAELVSKDLQKILKIWYKPDEIVPSGISKDGSKLYVDLSYDDDDILNKSERGLFLEISDDGTFKFIPRKNPDIITNHEYIEDFPKEENNAYLGYLKFTNGNIEHILKVSFPCT